MGNFGYHYFNVFSFCYWLLIIFVRPPEEENVDVNIAHKVDEGSSKSTQLMRRNSSKNLVSIQWEFHSLYVSNLISVNWYKKMMMMIVYFQHFSIVPQLLENGSYPLPNFMSKLKRWKELRRNILSHFFDGLSHGLSGGKPKTNGLLMKEKNQRGDSKAKRNEDGWGWRRLKRIGNDDLEKFS